MIAEATKKAGVDGGEEPLLGDAARPPDFSWLWLLGFAFLTCNLGIAIYRSQGDPAAVGFVAFSYLDIVLLFYCLRKFEKAQPDSPASRNLQLAVWILSTLLTAVFSYKIAAIVPLPMQILVWAMATATVGGGFYAFLSNQQLKDNARMATRV